MQKTEEGIVPSSVYSSDSSSTTGQWSLPWTSLQMSAF